MSSFFVSVNADGDIVLTVAGYVLVAIVIFALFVLIAALGNHHKKLSTRQLAFSAVAVALALVTSLITLFRMPMGGSITLCSMLFIVLVGYWYGPAIGIMTGVAYGLLQFVMDPYILSLPQVLLDYPLAFGALGFSGFFSNKKHGLLIGYIAGVIGRCFFAVTSGVVFFGIYAPEGMSPFTYSLAYNGLYLIVEAAITIVIISIPAVSRALAHIKLQATGQAA